MSFKVISKTENTGGFADGLSAGKIVGRTGKEFGRPENRDGLMQQYFSDPTRAYAAQYGDIADNVYAARCQGLDPDHFFDWHNILIRSANTEFTGYANARPDDTQRIYVLKPEHVVYLPSGALLDYGGNLWMVFRTRNLGVPHGSAILRRCNALTNVVLTDDDDKPHLEPVPLVLESAELSSALPYTGVTDSLASGQIRCYCQRCPATEVWQENTRIILGRSAFLIRGLDDFTREHTNDAESARIMSFTLQRTSPLPEDSIEKQCAGYGNYFAE